MERINKILRHPEYLACLEKNEMAEENRIFCHHHIEHFLSVARIAMLENLQENLQIDAEIIYSSAILHDIGRFLQYENGTPHEVASAEIAKKILFACDFDENETEIILQVILQHRGSKKSEDAIACGDNEKLKKDSSTKNNVKIIADLLYRADKMSRNCFCCKAYDQCNWPKERKEALLVY